jgi:lipid A disaccharide synthetase
MASSQIFISAGDPSGDNAGALLISAIKRKNAGLTFFGLGGQRMSVQEQEQLVESSRLVVGFGKWPSSIFSANFTA